MRRYVLGPKSSSYSKGLWYFSLKNLPNCSTSSIVGLSLSDSGAAGGVYTASFILLLDSEK